MTNIFHDINRLSEKYRDRTAANLSDLVKIKSLCGKEKAVQIKLAELMAGEGFDEVRTDGLGNVIGRLGNGKKILAFDGHVDTVDSGSRGNWSFDPFGGGIQDGYVHGRGTVDQKGGVASFITAGRILKELGFNKDLTIYFIGSVIEEDCEGLCWKYLIEEEKIRPDLVILTEPTGLNISRGQRGRMEFNIHFRGLSSHGSAPERGINAIYCASSVALKIDKLNSCLKSVGFLGKGSITVTEVITESPSLCAVPDYARLHIDRRLTTGESIKSVIKETEQLLRGYNANIETGEFRIKSWTGLEYGMEKNFPAWELAEDHHLVRTASDTFKSLFEKEPVVDKWLFSTNGIMTCGIHGIPTIGFGPGNEALAHAPDEKVLITDLVAASAFYAAIPFELCR